MAPTFSQSEVFPLVSRLILRAPPDATGFVSHEAIVSELLSNPEGSALVGRAAIKSSLPGNRRVASNMVAWFSQQITIGHSRWTEFFDRERRGGLWAYRPRTALATSPIVERDRSAIEGEPRLFFHFRRERDPGLAKAKRDAVRAFRGQVACQACGFSTEASFPGLDADICEVHHCLPLAAASEAVETRLEDLAILCPTCHRAIHRTNPMLDLETFRLHFWPPPPSATEA